MSTNPNNAVGTNAAYGGRTSVNAFNDDLGAYTRGILSGWACEPDSGLTVVLGGDGNTRDVAIAEDNAGNKTTINNISGSPISVTIDAAPTANSRIDLIVAYVDASPQGNSTITDNYEACGLITVSGTASASPVAPNDTVIRSAITADGASGATAYYVVLASITLASGTTTITSTEIEAGGSAVLQDSNLPSITSNMIDFTTFGVVETTSLGLSVSGGTFTAPTFGIAHVQTAVASNQYIDVSINNNSVSRIQGGASSFTWVSDTFILARGDILKVTSSDSGGNAQINPPRSNFYSF